MIENRHSSNTLRFIFIFSPFPPLRNLSWRRVDREYRDRDLAIAVLDQMTGSLANCGRLFEEKWGLILSIFFSVDGG